MNTNLKTVNLDDELFEPISFFGKENTRRLKRAHEIRPKKYPNPPAEQPLYDHDVIKTRAQRKYDAEMQQNQRQKHR